MSRAALCGLGFWVLLWCLHLGTAAAPTGSFYKGVAEGEVDPAFGPLEALRLSIQTDSPVWVILSEVRSAGMGLSS